MKILIVDDQPDKATQLQLFIELYAIYKADFFFASTYAMAETHLGDYYDIVLCDNYLGDNQKFGVDFLKEYQAKWRDSICFLYSAKSDKVNNSFVKNFKCFSFEAVKTEILILINNGISKKPLLSEAMDMQHAATLSMPGYSKELCDTLHAQNKEDHAVIKESIVEVKHSFKETSTEIKGAIAETRGDNKKILIAILGVIFTQLVTAISVVTFIVMIAGKIKS